MVKCDGVGIEVWVGELWFVEINGEYYVFDIFVGNCMVDGNCFYWLCFCFRGKWWFGFVIFGVIGCDVEFEIWIVVDIYL